MNLHDITKQIRAFADQLEEQNKPDPYAELKAAHAAGMVVEAQLPNGEWYIYNPDKPQWNLLPESYRIKPNAPSFQLPPPPPGMQWHRVDGWKADDLPPGTRPAALNEEIPHQSRESYICGQWVVQSGNTCITKLHADSRIRTSRPLVFEHAGKSWTYHRPGDPMPCDGEVFVDCLCDNEGELTGTRAKVWAWKGNIIGWRYAEPLTREVALGPEDVEPLSMIRRKGEGQSWHWRLLSYVHGTHAICADRGYAWSELARDYEINRPRHRDENGNPTLWEKCSKEVPA